MSFSFVVHSLSILVCAVFLTNCSLLQRSNTQRKGNVIPKKVAVTYTHSKGAAVTPFFSNKNTNNAFMAYLTLPKAGKIPEHRDSSEEYLYFLKGYGTLWIDKKPYAIKPHTAVYMPANSLVKFAGSSRSKIEIIQFFAPQGPEKKYDAWQKSVK